MGVRQAAFGRAVTRTKRHLLARHARGCRQEFPDRGSCRRAQRPGASAACPHRARRGAHRTRAPGERSSPPAPPRASRGVADTGMARELDESEGIAGGLREHATARLHGQPRREVIEQPVESDETAPPTQGSASRRPRARSEPHAKAGDEHHRLVVQRRATNASTSRLERSSQCASSAIKQQRARVRGVGNEPVCGEGNAERIGLHQVVGPERRVERLSLRIGEAHPCGY